MDKSLEERLRNMSGGELISSLRLAERQKVLDTGNSMEYMEIANKIARELKSRLSY